MIRRIAASTLSVAVLLTSFSALAQVPRPAAVYDVESEIAGLVHASVGQAAADAAVQPAALQRFYRARAFQPAWLSRGGREAARVLIERMRMAASDGLRPTDYTAGAWAQRLDAPHRTPGEAIASDVHLTATLLRFAGDLAYGAPDWTASARGVDVVQVLEHARDGRSARSAIARLTPDHPEYQQLRDALARYRAIAASGGWPAIESGVLLKLDPTLESAEAGPREASAVEALCSHLGIEGDVDPVAGCGYGPGDRPVYNLALEAAVRRFQARHGLAVDGVVGPNTIAALNVPAEARIDQIAITMNRWRRLPDDFGPAAVLVNIAGFRLEVRDYGRTALAMRVVTGEPDRPTPIMSDEIRYLVFRPYWNVPRSITQGELLPKIANDPAYLDEEGFQVVDGWSDPPAVVDPEAIDWAEAGSSFPYRLRQQPGRANSLGLVKFMFPNAHNVYLHDTPSTYRFRAPSRAFSHGCVRVEDPVGLATFLLRDDPAWSRDAIVEAMHHGGRRVVPLPRPVPVHLMYLTAWVEKGTVQFRPDVYGLDRVERRRLGAGIDTNH